MRLRLLGILEPCLLVLVPATLLFCAFSDIQQTALLTVLVAILALLPFFLRFELRHPQPRDIMPVVVLSAIAAVGRIVFAPFPNVKPVTALCIVAGISFGREAGFLVGALAAFASNMFFGQGPWTPWQMYAWGLTGYLAGALFSSQAPLASWGQRHPFVIYVFGALAALFYGFILDSWSLVGYVDPITVPAALILYGAGLPSSLVHATATVVFLVLLLKPWSRKLQRLKRKYGIVG
jgi:energy-coupling factor transport system substrate-specific component